MKEDLISNNESEASVFIKDSIDIINFELMSPLILEEVQELKRRRLRKKNGENTTTERRNTTALLSAEFFPDEKPPRLVIAESEDELHEDLRERFPSKNKRISGEIIKITNQENFQFFSMDPVDIALGSTNLPTEADLKEVLEYLLSQNIVPLDAEMRIIQNDNEKSSSEARIKSLLNL
jgi:hypothetical protein